MAHVQTMCAMGPMKEHWRGRGTCTDHACHGPDKGALEGGVAHVQTNKCHGHNEGALEGGVAHVQTMRAMGPMKEHWLGA